MKQCSSIRDPCCAAGGSDHNHNSDGGRGGRADGSSRSSQQQPASSSCSYLISTPLRSWRMTEAAADADNRGELLACHCRSPATTGSSHSNRTYKMHPRVRACAHTRLLTNSSVFVSLLFIGDAVSSNPGRSSAVRERERATPPRRLTSFYRHISLLSSLSSSSAHARQPHANTPLFSHCLACTRGRGCRRLRCTSLLVATWPLNGGALSITAFL